jgi:hypothetical protein
MGARRITQGAVWGVLWLACGTACDLNPQTLPPGAPAEAPNGPDAAAQLGGGADASIVSDGGAGSEPSSNVDSSASGVPPSDAMTEGGADGEAADGSPDAPAGEDASYDGGSEAGDAWE